MLSVDRVLRGMGAPGFETQMFVELAGRADARRLREAVARLSRAYPVVTARLIEEGRPRWQFRPGALAPLREVELTGNDEVLEYAGQLLSTPADPAVSDPLRFHLLHRPDGRDVFHLQYNHTLMDNTAAVALVRQINQSTGPLVISRRDGIRAYLRRFPYRQRKAAMDQLKGWSRSMQGGVAVLGRPRATPTEPMRLRLATRRLSAADTAALQGRAVRACGFPSLSMAVMASTFRALGQLTPQKWKDGCNFLAGIGVDLGLRGAEDLLLHNLVSVVPVRARSEELGDWTELTRLLSRQLRDRLADQSDLGMLQWTALHRKRPQQMRWILDLVLRIGFSLWYAYFGTLDAVGETFCGTPVEEVYYAGPSWAPMGMTLLANQWRSRLCLQATYVADSVPDALAEDFLNAIVCDLENTPA
jgi:hypothetical protein